MGTSHLISEQNSGSHSRKYHDEQRKELEIASQDAGTLGMTHVLAGKSSLDNDLITAPVPDAGDGEAESHS